MRVTGSVMRYKRGRTVILRTPRTTATKSAAFHEATDMPVIYSARRKIVAVVTARFRIIPIPALYPKARTIRAFRVHLHGLIYDAQCVADSAQTFLRDYIQYPARTAMRSHSRLQK